MLTTLGAVKLRSGKEMTMYLMEPPGEAFGERLLEFLRHKHDDSLRAIQQRVRGQYVDHAVDRYFVGEVDGRFVGHVWYGLPRGGTGVGNFGHVYTDPEWRGEGIATELCRVLVDHFNADPEGKALLCSAGAKAGRIYRKFGFQFIPPTAESGSMALMKGETFDELESRTFAPGRATTVRLGHIGDRHDIDRLLDFSPGWIAARKRWHFLGLASQVPTFIAALHMVEDGRGIVTVLQTEDGSIVGWAFALRLGAAVETTVTADFAVHPHYLSEGPRLLRETVGLAGQSAVYACVAACDEERVTAFAGAGFTEQYRFESGVSVDGKAYDLLLLRSS